jgi:L-fuconolactonase
VYAKVSNAVAVRDSLDTLWDVFGADRLLYGSNWPVSNKLAPYATVFRVVHEYFTAKGPQASEKFFWKNAKAAYRF